MKLWDIGMRVDLPKTVRDQHWGYDCTYAAVIRAKSEQEAREIASKSLSGDQGNAVWLDEALTDCSEVTQDGEPGVLIVDFLSG